MFSFLTDVEIYAVIGVVAFIAGVVLSTKVKDYIKGIPAQARVALNNVEAQALASVKQAQADALAKLPGAVAVKTPLAPAAVAPVASAPAVVSASAPTDFVPSPIPVASGKA